MTAVSSSNKENAPVASLSGGDVIGGRQAICSPKGVRDVFDGMLYPFHLSATILIVPIQIPQSMSVHAAHQSFGSTIPLGLVCSYFFSDVLHPYGFFQMVPLTPHTSISPMPI
jgi:hypothetical protein